MALINPAAKLRGTKEVFIKLVVCEKDGTVKDVADLLISKLSPKFACDRELLLSEVAAMINQHQHNAKRKELGILVEDVVPVNRESAEF